MNRKIILAAFFAVALVQLYVPAKMIWDSENVLRTGTEYKFKTAPVDPNDPFRGKYITLSYEENTVDVENEKDWKTGEKVYVCLTTDTDGFAKIKSASRERPTDDEDFVTAYVRFAAGNGSNTLTVDYPFDRYYMEESKALDAERTYRQSQQDTSKVTYALVNIRQGEAVLKDVLIDGVSLREIVKANREQNRK